MDKALYDRQLANERLSLDLGIERYRSEQPLPWRAEANQKKEEADLPPGKKLLLESIEPVAVALDAWREHANSGKAGRRHTAVPYLASITSMQAAYIASRVIINCASLRDSYLNTIRSIGRAIERHLEIDRLQAQAPGLFITIERQLDKSTSARHREGVMRAGMRTANLPTGEWDATTQTRVGEVLYELFTEHTGLVETYTTMIRKNKRVLRVKPTEECLAWLARQHARCEILAPIYLPMLVEPVAWSTPYDGGYLDRGLSAPCLVKTSSRNYLEELAHVDMPKVYEAVNAIQATPWRINSRILGVMREVWDGGGSLGGLPARDDLPIPSRPTDADIDPAGLKQWKVSAARVYEANARLRSKRLAQMQKLWLAEKFADESAIYFPHCLDFRGRVYPTVPFVNPQADDSGKALLEFAEGVSLGESGAYWLAVHLANLFGVDKTGFDERVNWTLNNEDAILDSALSPLDGKRFWTEADSPYCALAACFEWLGFKMNGQAHVSHLPVAVDGSCSGLQHFSAMLRDPIGGAAVNLTPNAKPADIYTQVAEVVQREVDESSVEEAQPWKAGKVVRKIAKQPTMTLSYGATKLGMKGQILSALTKMDEDYPGGYLEGASNLKCAGYLSEVVYDGIGDVVVAARAAMDWLRTVARIAAQDGLPIHWTTPAGFPVIQAYRKGTSRRIECFVGGRRHSVTLMDDHPTKLDKRRQATGISPNFVHSLDAAHLMSTVVACGEHGITSFAMIHDSFGTHAGRVDELSYILRRTFVDQYTPNVLAEFRSDIVGQLPPALAEKIPEVPPMGTLDLEAVMEAQYFFA